jgi:outer membrane immunogenic protein
MKRILLSMTGVLALAVLEPAAAADIPHRPPVYTKAPPAPLLFDWSGFYVGVNGGWAWSRSNYDFAGGSTSIKGGGGLVGGTLGYNRQVGQAVFGLEGDLDWADVHGSAVCAVGTCETTNKWLSTVRGRIGYAVDRFLPYVTGGVAFGKLEANVPGVGSASNTRTGWTAGAGLEYAVTHNWSVKTEYLYVDLGKFSCGAAVCGAPANVDYRAHIVRAGLNYKF